MSCLSFDVVEIICVTSNNSRSFSCKLTRWRYPAGCLRQSFSLRSDSLHPVILSKKPFSGLLLSALSMVNSAEYCIDSIQTFPNSHIPWKPPQKSPKNSLKIGSAVAFQLGNFCAPGLAQKNPALRVLEVGVFEGRSTTWLLENFCRTEESTIVAVDTFQGGIEHQGMELGSLRARFEQNIAAVGSPAKVEIRQGFSLDELSRLVTENVSLSISSASMPATKLPMCSATPSWPSGFSKSVV
jgi:hypothetical protein